jgi:hypothetical protein
MSQRELETAGRSLERSHERVRVLLVAAAELLRELGDVDERAVWLSDRIGEAFTEMEAENIAAASVLAGIDMPDRENRL